MKLEDLEWDSKYWGIRMAKLVNPDSRIMNQYLEDFRYDFIRTRISTTDTPLLTILEDVGFRIYDTLVYLELKFDHMNGNFPRTGNLCRWYEDIDIETIRGIASSSFNYDHHHQDRKFDTHKVDRMHELWIDKCIKEEYDIDVVEKDDKVAGFIATKDKDDSCYIELIAVDEKFRGQGIAEDLLRFTLTRAAFKLPRATVETQIANVPAIRLYEKLGFRLVKSEYTLHWWKSNG